MQIYGRSVELLGKNFLKIYRFFSKNSIVIAKIICYNENTKILF